MKRIGFLLVALMFVVAGGCKQPAVTTPDPGGFKAPERIEPQTVNAAGGGGGGAAKKGSGPPTETQSQEVD